MKKLCILFLLISVLSGCAAQNSSTSEPMVAQKTDYQSYLEVFSAQRPLFERAIQSNDGTAPIVALSIAPAAPRGSTYQFSNLRSLSIRTQPDIRQTLSAAWEEIKARTNRIDKPASTQ